MMIYFDWLNVPCFRYEMPRKVYFMTQFTARRPLTLITVRWSNELSTSARDFCLRAVPEILVSIFSRALTPFLVCKLRITVSRMTSPQMVYGSIRTFSHRPLKWGTQFIIMTAHFKQGLVSQLTLFIELYISDLYFSVIL